MLCTATVTVLRDWLEAHKDSPFPSLAAKKDLATHTGVAVAELARWFTNERKRFLRRTRPAETRKRRTAVAASTDAADLGEPTAAMDAAVAASTDTADLEEPTSATDSAVAAALERVREQEATFDYLQRMLEDELEEEESADGSGEDYYSRVLAEPDAADRLLLRLAAGLDGEDSDEDSDGEDSDAAGADAADSDAAGEMMEDCFGALMHSQIAERAPLCTFIVR